MARTYLDLPLAPPDHGEGVSSWHFWRTGLVHNQDNISLNRKFPFPRCFSDVKRKPMTYNNRTLLFFSRLVTNDLVNRPQSYPNPNPIICVSDLAQCRLKIYSEHRMWMIGHQWMGEATASMKQLCPMSSPSSLLTAVFYIYYNWRFQFHYCYNGPSVTKYFSFSECDCE